MFSSAIGARTPRLLLDEVADEDENRVVFEASLTDLGSSDLGFSACILRAFGKYWMQRVYRVFCS